MVPTAWEKMMLQESEKKEWYILSEWNVGFRIIVIYLKEREYNPLRVRGGGWGGGYSTNFGRGGYKYVQLGTRNN